MRRKTLMFCTLAAVALLAMSPMALALPTPLPTALPTAEVLAPAAPPGFDFSLLFKVVSGQMSPAVAIAGVLVAFLSQLFKNNPIFKFVRPEWTGVIRSMVVLNSLIATVILAMLDGTTANLDVLALVNKGMEAVTVLTIATVTWLVALKTGKPNTPQT